MLLTQYGDLLPRRHYLDGPAVGFVIHKEQNQSAIDTAETKSDVNQIEPDPFSIPFIEPAPSKEYDKAQEKLKLGNRYARLKEMCRRLVKSYILTDSEDYDKILAEMVEEL